MDQTRTHTGHFVSNNARPNPTAADGHAAIDGSSGNSASQRLDKIRVIIIRIRLTVAEVGNLVAGTYAASERVELSIRSLRDQLRRQFASVSCVILSFRNPALTSICPLVIPCHTATSADSERIAIITGYASEPWSDKVSEMS